MNAADRTRPDPRFYRLVLGFELLRLREEQGLTQPEVVRALRLGPTVLSDYERLRSAPSVADTERLFRHYGIEDEERLDTLKAFAREARRRNKSKPRDPAIPGWFELYAMLEQHASELKLFTLSLVPGLFQTAGYAEAILRAGVYHDAADVERLVEVRIGRQQLLDNPNVHVRAVIKEAALRAPVGGPKVMAEQLDHLIALQARRNVTIHVLPDAVGAHPSMGAGFAILEFSAAGIAVAYSETMTEGQYEKTPAGVDLYRRAYLQLTGTALGEEPSVQRMQNIRDNYQP